MAKAKKKTSEPKKPRKPIHVIDVGSRSLVTAYADRDVKALCGAAIWFTESPGGVRITSRHAIVTLQEAILPGKAWIPFGRDRARSDYKYRPCYACRKLALLSPAERAAAIKERDADKLSKSEADKLARADAKQEAIAALELEIEATRVDALVCLDKLERDQEYLHRCKRIVGSIQIVSNGGLMTRCNLPKHHVEKCRGKLPNERMLVDIDEVLAVAIKAQKLASGKPDRGDRLYVQRTRYCCNGGCEWVGYQPNKNDGFWCPNHLGDYAVTAIPDQPLNKKDLICRFCDHVIDRDYKLGTDYSNITPVKAHCIPCALRFLGKVEATNLDDAPATILSMPASSFVLEHDS